LGEGATNDQMRSFYSTDKNIHEAIFSASVISVVVIIQHISNTRISKVSREREMSTPPLWGAHLPLEWLGTLCQLSRTCG